MDILQNCYFQSIDLIVLILCLQKGVRLSSVSLLLPLYKTFSIPVKNETCGEEHKSKFHDQ